MDVLRQLRSLRSSLPSSEQVNETLQEDLYNEARNLLLDLERPDQAVERVAFQVMETVFVTTAVKMGLFKALNKSTASSADDIAKACNVDPILAGRVLLGLAAYGDIGVKEPGIFTPSTVSRAFVERKSMVTLDACEWMRPGWLAIPSYLQEKKWRNPTSATDTPMAKGYNRPEGATAFDIATTSPLLDSINSYMASHNDNHRQWFEFYPVMERLGDGAEREDDSVMMVDVGGGLGHQAINLRRKFPDLPGRFIVQDLAQSFPAERSSDVEFMEHDFTMEPPIKGARLYYLRYVPHDWSQDFNTRLCSLLRKAMKPGYSKLIVNEWIIPETGPTRFMAAFDFNMMAVGGGMERTEALHREYLEKAGLKVVKIYSPGDRISECVIEAEVA